MSGCLFALGPFERSFTETLLNADVFRFDASDLKAPDIAFGPIEQVGAPFDFPPFVIIPSQPTGF